MLLVDVVFTRPVVGGKKGEVAIMNGLTVNLHLLLVCIHYLTLTCI